jgi:hypothetical protein
MTLGAKILVISAFLCLIVWGVFLAIGAQPLFRTGSLQVIYGEHEDFFADAEVYRKARNHTYYILHLPRARSVYRWWTVDFNDMMIARGGAPHSLGTWKYLLRGDQGGIKIDDAAKMGDWFWHFDDSGAAFFGNGFTCSVRRMNED